MIPYIVYRAANVIVAFTSGYIVGSILRAVFL